MKVLLASITAGQGHHATAAAIESAMKARGADVETIDIFKYINTYLYKAVDKGYLMSTKHTWQYGVLYHAFESDSLLRKAVISFMNSEILSDKLFRHFEHSQPDVVISTHPCAAQIIDELKEQKILKSVHIGVNTDYTLLPFWETIRHMSGLVICGRQLVFRARQKGISPDILLPFGIPVQNKYYQSIPKGDALKKLGLDPDIPAALIMSGSMGYGNLAETVEKLASSGLELQIICVCGRNDKAREELEGKSYPVKVLALGFIDYVHECMDAADVVVTKPGGLSVSEALAKKKPLVLTSPIPGHEQDNMTCLVNYGLAVYSTNGMPVHELVCSLLSDPDRLEQMKRAIETYACPNSTERLCDHIYEIVEQRKKEGSA